MSRPLAVGLLLITTLLWGFAFVAQKTAMAEIGPLTFAAVRYALGTMVMLPLVIWERRGPVLALTRRSGGAVAFLSVVFFLGVWLQQAGLQDTTVTNSGFLTGLYVLFVPLLALVVLRQPPHPIAWICVPLALLGIFALNGGQLQALNRGDLLVVLSAVCWAVQVLILGTIVRWTNQPVTVSALCFLATAVLSGIGAFLIETPQLPAIAAAWPEIVYSGVLSTAVAFTLQAVAQRHVPPANAAVILSSESLFAAIGGAWLLGERLPAIGYLGAAMIFAAIVLVELVPALRRRAAIGVPSSS